MSNDGIQGQPVDDDTNEEKTFRFTIDNLIGGLNTKTYPHALPSTDLVVASNVVFTRDGIISKRPGNQLVGATGSGMPIKSMYRAYPPMGNPFTLVQSNGQLYTNQSGSFQPISGGTVGASGCNYQQMYDVTQHSWEVFIVDGVNPPKIYNGTTIQNVTQGIISGVNYLPNGEISGTPINPAYVCEWENSLVYAGIPSDPTALYISDPLSPETFTGFPITSVTGYNPIPYYPAAQDASLGVITGIAVVGVSLGIFFSGGVVIATNTGSYGAFEYTFQRLSSSIGCTSPRSMVLMDGYIAWYGGNRFYATDLATYIAPIPDMLPTYYNGNKYSSRPTIIKNDSTVFGVRYFDEIIWSFDSTGQNILDQEIVFNQAANNNWQPGQLRGGAWSSWPSGMPMECGVWCKIGQGGDYGQLFWGSSILDVVAQHDTTIGTNPASGIAGFNDFGAPITMEVRAKSFFFDKPMHLKLVQSLYCVCVFDTQEVPFTVSLDAYVYLDTTEQLSPNPIIFNVPPTGTPWNTQDWNTFNWASSLTINQSSNKAFFGNQCLGLSISPGFIESSINPVNFIAFVLEATIDPPQP